MRYMPKATVRDWVQAKKAQQAEHGFDPQLAARAIALRRSLIRELDKAGAGFLLGSDAPQIFNVPGFSLHRELELLVAAGLSPFAALRAGTVAPAEFLGLNTGMVAVGRDADLVLLDANPLSDVANTRRIHGVMLRGQWYPAGTLQARIDRFLSAD
jgi:imidazolonepropionase-like amidohydrolase